MSFTLTSISPTTFPKDGGYKLTITGTFESNQPYRVHIGEDETTGDAQCYSGKAGQGNIIYPVTSTILQCYSPLLLPPGPYSVLVINTLTLEQHILSGVITTIHEQLESKIFTIRSILPNYYKTGPRIIDQVETTV